MYKVAAANCALLVLKDRSGYLVAVLTSVMDSKKHIFTPDRLSHLPGPKGGPLHGNLLDIEQGHELQGIC